MSDHILTLALLKQTKLLNKEAMEFESQRFNDKSIRKIKSELFGVDWNGILNSSDCNDNFNKFCDILMEIMDKIIPIVKVCVSAKRRYVEPWMTRGLELSSGKKR